MVNLQFYLLGPPGIYWNGHTLPIPRRQARALLYRLAMRKETVTREHLCYLLWADLPDVAARRNLTHLMTHLRRALPLDDMIVADADQVMLDPDRFWSDTDAIEQVLGNLTDNNLDELETAATYYRGAFLSGFSLPCNPEFEAWIRLEQSVRERIYLDLLKHMLELYQAQHCNLEAIAVGERYLQTNLLDEDVHQHLIELYAMSGDRAAALGQYRRCADALGRELGVLPLQKTKRLYLAALKGRLSA